MFSNQAKAQTPEIVNGIEVDKITSVIDDINIDANNGKWQFRSTNSFDK